MRDISYDAHCLATEGADVRSRVVDGFLVRGDVIDADVKAIGRELDRYAFATMCLIRPIVLQSWEDGFAYIP